MTYEELPTPGYTMVAGDDADTHVDNFNTGEEIADYSV